MFESIKSRTLTLNRHKRFQTILIYAAGLLIFAGGVFDYVIVAQTPAPPTDKLQSATQTANQSKAEKLLGEAAVLQNENTTVAKRRAIVKYKQAADLLRNNTEQRSFVALDGIAKLYKELNEPDRAVSYWKQSLSTLRRVKYRTPEITEAEGITLLQIGAVYDEKGDRKTALKNYLQTLDLTRDYKGYAAAGALNSIIALYLKAKQPERAAQFLEQEIVRAGTAKDAEMKRALSDILNQVKNGTFKKNRPLLSNQ